MGRIATDLERRRQPGGGSHLLAQSDADAAAELQRFRGFRYHVVRADAISVDDFLTRRSRA